MQYRYDSAVFLGAYRYDGPFAAGSVVQLTGANCAQVNLCSTGLFTYIPPGVVVQLTGAGCTQLNACSGGSFAAIGALVADMCRVTGVLRTIANMPARNVLVTFSLVSPSSPVRVSGGLLIGGRTTTVRSDVLGMLSVDLFRNDRILPAGSLYQVSCKELAVAQKNVVLAAQSADLVALLSS